MQMSEPFATTVAAVAPVVWLVGAVEYHQISKRTVDVYAAGEELLTLTVQDLQRASDTEVLAHRWTESQQRLQEPPVNLMPLYVVWSVVTGCLLFALVVALEWLVKGDAQNKASGDAAFCYYTLCFSFLVVTVLPVIAATRRIFKSSSRRRALRGEIDRLKFEARQRQG
jgi:hypothetical protein